jgi:NADPH2:quinone reductase
MSYQKALLTTKIGSPLVLSTDRQIPFPGPGQVLTKVVVASLNPHDTLSRDHGLFIADRLPAVLASDVVGIVHKLGSDVCKYALGDRIAWQSAFTGGHETSGLQEWALADVDFSAKIPPNISNDAAATLPTNLVTSFLAIFGTLGIPLPWGKEQKDFDYARTTLLIIGGGGNCAKYGVQLAKLAGLGKIVVVGGDEVELKSYGATDVLDRHNEPDLLLERIRQVVGDDLIYAYDTVNPPEGQLLALNALSSSKRGILARLLPRGPVDESKVPGKKAGFEVRDHFGSSHAHPALAAPFWDRLSGFLEAGTIKPLAFVAENGLDAAKVNAVLDAYAAGSRVNKTNINL